MQEGKSAHIFSVPKCSLFSPRRLILTESTVGVLITCWNQKGSRRSSGSTNLNSITLDWWHFISLEGKAHKCTSQAVPVLGRTYGDEIVLLPRLLLSCTLQPLVLVWPFIALRLCDSPSYTSRQQSYILLIFSRWSIQCAFNHLSFPLSTLRELLLFYSKWLFQVMSDWHGKEWNYSATWPLWLTTTLDCVSFVVCVLDASHCWLLFSSWIQESGWVTTGWLWEDWVIEDDRAVFLGDQLSFHYGVAYLWKNSDQSLELLNQLHLILQAV